MIKNDFDDFPSFCKEEALEILSTPINKLRVESDYYKAVSNLSKFPSIETQDALLNFLKKDVNKQPISIARRKAIEVLGTIGNINTIPSLIACLKSSDKYIIENAALALEKLGHRDDSSNKMISSLLDDPKQSRRALLKSLAGMEACSELHKIKYLANDNKLEPSIRGAAISALAKLTNSRFGLEILSNYLLSNNQNDRQCAVNDIIDAGFNELIDDILKSPVYPFFRTRAVREMHSIDVNNQSKLIRMIDNIFLEDLSKMYLIYSVGSQEKSIKYLIDQCFSTDFNVASIAVLELNNFEVNDLFPVLSSYFERFKIDYGALYFLMIIFRDLIRRTKYFYPEMEVMCLYCLTDNWPTYMKFRPQAIINLSFLDPDKYEAYLTKWLNSDESPFWASRYAALIGVSNIVREKHNKLLINSCKACKQDSDSFVSAKASLIIEKYKYS